MTLGEQIKKYRDEHKISLRSFARATNLSPTYISYLEKGETQRGTAPVPSIDTYKAVANAMGMTTDDLVRLVDDVVCINTDEKAPAYKGERDYSPALKKIVDELCALPDDQLDKLLTLIRSAKDIL